MILGLIPARGGSQRLPRKNLVDLGGRPLLAWTVEEAYKAISIGAIVVSTEDPEIATFAKSLSCSTINRPPQLATDDSQMLPVLHHAVRECGNPDVIVLLQPTSPFRTAQDIEEALALFKARNADAVVSVTSAPDDHVFEVGHAGRMRKSTNVVVPNGAIYIISTEALLQGHNWYDGVTYAYEMPRERSIDIDTSVDLAMARAALEHKGYEAA